VHLTPCSVLQSIAVNGTIHHPLLHIGSEAG